MMFKEIIKKYQLLRFIGYFIIVNIFLYLPFILVFLCGEPGAGDLLGFVVIPFWAIVSMPLFICLSIAEIHYYIKLTIINKKANVLFQHYIAHKFLHTVYISIGMITILCAILFSHLIL